MPDDEEARIVVEATGADIPALAARLRAHAAAHEAARGREGMPPAAAPAARPAVASRGPWRVALIAAAAAILAAGIAAAVTIARQDPRSLAGRPLPRATVADTAPPPPSRAREIPVKSAPQAPPPAP
jgi:hypothetical protein